VRPWPTDERWVEWGHSLDGRSWDAYWADWETALLCCSPLLIDKTRRVMASNIVCAWDLWVASGGQDPRWPALMLSTQNRKVIVQSRKLEDEGGSAEFVGRIGEMYRIAVEQGLRERWPGFPEWKFSFGNGRASNGGRITAVPQGADQIRGPGTTLLHAEELSFWTEAGETLETAIPALHPYGHLVAVTTPAVGTYAKDIRDGLVGRG